MYNSNTLHEVKHTQGRFVVKHSSGESVLTYAITSPQFIIAESIVVAPGKTGQGIERQLLKLLIKHASKKGVKIIPLCPVVNGLRCQNPKWVEHFAV